MLFLRNVTILQVFSVLEVELEITQGEEVQLKNKVCLKTI